MVTTIFGFGRILSLLQQWCCVSTKAALIFIKARFKTLIFKVVIPTLFGLIKLLARSEF